MQLFNICCSIVVLSTLLDPGEACSCMETPHPQQLICDDVSFVMKVVVNQTYYKMNGNTMVSMADVNIVEDYKDPSNNGEDKVLMLTEQGGSCDVYLTDGYCYVIAGLRSSYQVYFACTYIRQCSQLTPAEIAGFDGEYEKGCDCEIEFESANQFFDVTKKHQSHCVLPLGPYVRTQCFIDTAHCQRAKSHCRRNRVCGWVTDDPFKCGPEGDH